MRSFKLDNQYSIVCESKSTRNGFKHEATLLNNGIENAFAKVCYCNRTWEAYEFETVMLRLIDANFEDKQKEKYRKAIKWENIR